MIMYKKKKKSTDCYSTTQNLMRTQSKTILVEICADGKRLLSPLSPFLNEETQNQKKFH